MSYSLENSFKNGTASLMSQRDWLDGEVRWLQSRLSQILDITEEAIISVGRDSRINFFNRGAQNLFGYRPDEVINRNIEVLLPINLMRGHDICVPKFGAFSENRLWVGKFGPIFGRCKNGSRFPVDGEISEMEINGEKVFTVILRQRGENLSLDSGEMKNPGFPQEDLFSLFLEKENYSHPGNKNLEREVIARTRKVHEVRDVILFSLLALSEGRHEYMDRHQQRIQHYSSLLGEALSRFPKYKKYISDEYLEDLFRSSLLHDIGEVGIPDRILLKPGELTSLEFEEMERHVLIGGETIERAEGTLNAESFLSLGMQIAYFHHERWDGSGYMTGLKGEDIPLSARIVALADVYDALTSPRPYKSAVAHAEARKIIVSESGKHFDPDVVEAFLHVENKFDEKGQEIRDIVDTLNGLEVCQLSSGVVG